MKVNEWKKDNKFRLNLRTCGACLHCKYDNHLNIMYCIKMLEETNSHINDCKVDFEKSWCKEMIEE